MADTTVSPNNQQVRFRGRATKEQAMPNVSEAQRGAMAAAEDGKSKLGIPKKVGKEFMDSDEGGKLPDRADKLHKQGLISDKSLQKMRAKQKADKEPPGSDPDEKIEGGPKIKGVKTGDNEE